MSQGTTTLTSLQWMPQKSSPLTGCIHCKIGQMHFMFIACCSPPCQNGGLCDTPGVCECSAGWNGSRCEQGEFWGIISCQLNGDNNQVSVVLLYYTLQQTMT